ncbi:MAG: methylmalonyl-CoA mutase family protein [Polyangiales bacterium]
MNPDALAAWRALVEKDLKGASFEKSLVTETPEGISLPPLYTDTPWDPGVPGAAPFTRGPRAEPFAPRVCMRVAGDDPEAQVRDDLDGGADALWLDAHRADALRPELADADARGVALLLDARPGDAPRPAAVFAADPLGLIAAGALSPEALPGALTWLVDTARALPGVRVARVSTLAVHAAGADAADELAYALSAAAAYLRALTDAGVDLADAAATLTAQVAVGRDTFGELCKLRALRTLWHKLLAAAGAPDTALRGLHAVCATRTLSQRDPWVNLLRVTTEVFAAMVGGAEYITPRAFDEALAARSPLGRRAARNTALVLRDESHLARVLDPAGGSYAFEHRTHALAREAWARFTAMERDGGVAALLSAGTLRARYEQAWAKRAVLLDRRREAVLGVSEFANLTETLPARPAASPAPLAPALVPHRDGERFEAIRDRAETPEKECVLLTLGPPAEHRARAAFAAQFFAAFGVHTREIDAPAEAPVVCLCGSDERYASEAAAAARALRGLGCQRVILAGRPGALEGALREAGVNDFIFLGCDAVATMNTILEGVR